jgi:hypothetical protein
MADFWLTCQGRSLDNPVCNGSEHRLNPGCVYHVNSHQTLIKMRENQDLRNKKDCSWNNLTGMKFKDVRRYFMNRRAILHPSNSDTKWWFEKVVVPIAVPLIIGSGSILGIIINVISAPKPSVSPNPSVIQPVTPNTVSTPLGQEKP